MLKMILCLDKNNGLGKNNSLAWSVKEEMNHFKTTTINKTVVMGYNTFLSMNSKLLANRKNIIISSKKDLKIKNAIVTDDINKIIRIAKKEDVYIIGGKKIYETFNEYCDEIILSKLNKAYDCDLFYYPQLLFFKLNKTVEYKDFSVLYYKNIYKKLLDGRRVKDVIQKKLIEEKEILVKKTGIIPKLVIIQVGNNDASNIYVKNKIKLANELSIDIELVKLKESIKQNELNEIIIKLNKDNKVHGILVQSPLPKHLNINIVSNLIDINKDVDCFNPYNAGLIFRGEFDKIITYPCTPLGIIELLKQYQISLESKNAVVIGRSNIVTKPLAMLLLNENCTVTIVHSKTKNLNSYLKNADLIFSAAGKVNLINKNNIKKGSIIIDISMNRDKNNKLCGDVSFNDVINKVKYITPIPGGVGPLTLIMLFRNLLELYKVHHEIK